MQLSIIWPTLVLVLLIFVVWATLFLQRFSHMRKSPPAQADFANREAVNRYFMPVELPANNLANLFEMPVLYFALVPLLMITNHASGMQVGLAWAFVGVRVLHSVAHVWLRNIRYRIRAYLASCATLSAMWIGFAVDLVNSHA